jgi:hypothetical protein
VEGGIIKSKSLAIIRQIKCDQTKELIYKKPAQQLFVAAFQSHSSAIGFNSSASFNFFMGAY